MHRLLLQIKQTAFLPPASSRLLLAVSGGADSLAMLLLLAHLQDEFGWHISVGHVNHGLRPEADGEEDFVHTLTAQLKFDFYAHRVRIASKRGFAPEEEARLARRYALLAMAKDVGADYIALAHHAQDQAETLLMRLLNGTGLTGLAGMRPLTTPWWRPLLYINGILLRTFLREQSQTWCEDHSNQQLDFNRNRVRHQLLPVLTANFNPRVVEALSRLAGLCADEEDYWLAWAGRAADMHLQKLDSEWLLNFHPAWGVAQKRRFLRYVLGLAYGQSQHSLAVHVEQLLALSNKLPGKRQPLPGGWLAWREKEGLALVKHSVWTPLQFEGPASFFWPAQNCWYSMELVEQSNCQDGIATTVWLPAQYIDWPLTLTAPAPGTRFHAAWGRGERKISWLLQDWGVPRRQRARALLLSDSQDAWWLAPWRLSQRAAERTQDYQGPWLKIFPALDKQYGT